MIQYNSQSECSVSSWNTSHLILFQQAEHMEQASTRRQAAWLRSFNGEIGFPIEGPIPLCSDNQAAIFLMVNPAVEC